MRTDIPRLLVSLAGTEVPGLLDGMIEAVAARAASRFTLTFATQSLVPGIFDDPDGRLTLTNSRSQTPLLTGRPDSVTVDRIAGTTTIEGRDLAALFIDQDLTETYANRPASDIATDLANRHGLSAAVAATNTPAGRLFGSDHALLALATEWDLLSALAAAESFDLYVADTTLTFGPPRPSSPFNLSLSDCISLRQTTTPAIARTIELTVRSWDVAAAQPIVHTATRGQGTPRRQHLTRPNLTQETAGRLADSILADLARFERTAAVTMPGESMLGIGSVVSIGSDIYRVATLHRDWGTAGFFQTLFLLAAS